MTKQAIPRRTRRRFSPEFKQEAVRLHRNSDLPVSQVCKQLDISPSMLARWVKQADDESGPREGPTIAELIAENRRLRQELEFAKKISSYFASQLPINIR